MRHALLASLEGIEGLPVVAKEQVADGHIDQSEGVGRKMLNCLFVALNSFLVLRLVLVDVGQVVVGVAVAGVNLDGLLVPLDGLVSVVLSLVDDCSVVVGAVVLGVSIDGLLVVLESEFVFPHVVVGDAHRVVKGIYLLVDGVCTFIGLREVLYRKFVGLFVIVSQTSVVIVKVGIYLVLLQQAAYLFRVVL